VRDNGIDMVFNMFGICFPPFFPFYSLIFYVFNVREGKIVNDVVIQYAV